MERETGHKKINFKSPEPLKCVYPLQFLNQVHPWLYFCSFSSRYMKNNITNMHNSRYSAESTIPVSSLLIRSVYPLTEFHIWLPVSYYLRKSGSLSFPSAFLHLLLQAQLLLLHLFLSHLSLCLPVKQKHTSTCVSIKTIIRTKLCNQL